ncbi:CNP1-like family protein [Accumulibacter sp.]|uniref:CNP1-like family protein n=1 Tax=Accumulibacter sp. TaxID=2053492 RepID=UPI0028C4E0B3|nr:CNP1-like family protein [Accumulibacter sp.]
MNRPLPECSNLRPLSIWRLVRWPLSLLLLFPSIALSASEDDLATKRGQETEVQLPPFPQAENLIPFVVSAMTDNKFMIDGESLTVSTDGIVRYTLVIISSAGAQNVSYEAIRCPTAERRVYAFGHSADKTWSRARRDQWTQIQESTLNRHHAALFSDYFCAVGINLRDADDARRSLRSSGNRSHLRP